jgi:uncharacterized protein (UPF0335 family)
MSEQSNTPKIMELAERIVRLEKEKIATEDMIKEIYFEARSVGYQPKILKRAIKIASLSDGDRKKILAEEEILGLYLDQLDMFK